MPSYRPPDTTNRLREEPMSRSARTWLAAGTVVLAAGLISSACSSTGTKASAQGGTDATTTTMPAAMSPPTTSGYGSTGTDPDAGVAIAGELARARAATARYATDLDAAKADGYRIITPMMENMG